MASRRLTPQDWAMAALHALARGGLPAISVEALARELGATRGSFYWHFANRDAVVTAALQLWQREATESVIAGLGAEPDPGLRLRRLIEFAVTVDPIAGLEPALTAHARHPAVAPVLRDVTEARIGFLTGCYRELGSSPAEARRRAVVAYAAYLGWLDLRALGGDDLPEVATQGQDAHAALDELVETLLPPGTNHPTRPGEGDRSDGSGVADRDRKARTDRTGRS
ncbi:MAG: TetR/AcrR family transcriptional regulator [Kineosporiaceae bacterium]|jgi:AcrR family transcriptional regulator